MKSDGRSPQDRPFEGGAFHPRLPDGRAHGLVSLAFDAVRFESEKGAFNLPLHGLKLELGGANDRLVFLSHPSHSDVTIHTADHEILNHPVVTQTPGLASQCARIRSKKRVTSVVLLSVLGAVVAAVVALVFARSWLVRAAAATVPVAWEIKAGDTLFGQVIAGKREIKDPELERQLTQLTAPLVQGIADKRYPITFHIIEDGTLNAFAMPGGHVVLHSGLLLAADQPEEIAGVLAHEIAHVTRRHSIRNVISSAGLYLVLSALIGDASGILAVLANNSAYLLDRKFTRDFEREADDTGWDYLLLSAIEPSGMITFFKRMQREEKDRREKSPLGGLEDALTVVSTHPETQERIDHLEKKLKAMSKRDGFPIIPLNYTEFKSTLRAKLHAANEKHSE